MSRRLVANPQSARSKHPEIKKLNGYDTRTLWVGIAVALTQLGIACFFQAQRNAGSLFGSLGAIAVTAYLLGAILSHWCGMTIHECSHNLAARSRAMNKALSVFVNIPMVFPIAMSFRRYHIDHHILLGVEKEDTDLPLAGEVRHIGSSRIRKLFWLLGYFFVYVIRGLTFARKPNRDEIWNWVFQLAVVALIARFIGFTALGYLTLSTILGFSLHPVAAHFIHEHYVFSRGQETYSYYGPLNWVTYNVGYHYEHHDFMDVPGWSLPRLHRIAREFYEPLKSHRSWTYVLWHFIMSPEMGAQSRIVRSRETHDRVRRELRRNHTRPAGRREISASGRMAEARSS